MRLRQYDEQLKSLLLNIERDAAVLADRNLRSFNRNTPPMSLDELADILSPHINGKLKIKLRTRSYLQLLVSRSATMVANNILLDYSALEEEQKAQFTALFRHWSARGFDWGLACEPTLLTKIGFIIFFAQYRNQNGCRVSTQSASRPFLRCIFLFCRYRPEMFE